MKSELRVVVAAVVLAHSRQKQLSSIYSYSESSHRNINVKASGSTINAYDYSTSSHVTGQLSNLYHHGIGSHFQLKPNGPNAYTGYDFDSGSHFAVQLNGVNVQIYDYEHAEYFNYSG